MSRLDTVQMLAKQAAGEPIDPRFDAIAKDTGLNPAYENFRDRLQKRWAAEGRKTPMRWPLRHGIRIFQEPAGLAPAKLPAVATPPSYRQETSAL